MMRSWWTKRHAPATGGVGLYGKHPSAGDFLRMQVDAETLKKLDQWLSAALVAGSRLGQLWDEHYAAAPPVSFIGREAAGSAGGALLLGVLAPSFDRSGRAFPLVIFATLPPPTVDQASSALPMLEFFVHAERVLAQRDQLDREALVAASVAIAAPDAAQLQRAEQQQRDTWAATDSAVAFESLLGPIRGGAATSALSWVHELGQALARTTSQPRYHLRLPVGSLTPALAVSLWLRLLLCDARSLAMPCVCWDRRSMVLSLDQLDAKALVALWAPTFNDDTLYELTTVSAAHGMTLPAARLPAVGRSLAAMLR